jgi:tetratricopeptide (TPR) repeat protein
MFRGLLAFAIAGVLLGSVATGCGGSKKPVKTSKRKDKKKDTSSILREARDEAKAGEVDAADALYEEAYDIGGEFDVLEERVEFLIHQGRATRAQAAAKVFYDKNGTDPKGYVLYAEALLAGQKGQEALDVSDQLIGLNGEAAVGYEKKGRALLLLDRNEEALDMLRKSVAMDSDNADYHVALGLALHKLGKIDEAQISFRTAVKKAPDDAMVHVYLGMALRDQGELDDAQSALEKAIELDGKNGRAYFELGLLYNRKQKQSDAEAALSKAVQLSPNESLFWYAYGEIYRVQERFDDAIAAYRKALDLDPPHPKALGKLANLLVDRKQYDEAEQLLIPAIRKEPKAAINYFSLGVVYQARKKNKLAIDNYEKFLDLAPKDDKDRARARDAIRELKRR